MRLFWRARQEREMREELRLHLQREADALVERGQSREEAERSAAQLFGNVTAVREECRETRGLRWLENFGRDVGYGLRGLRRTPAFSAVAVLSLALGIGANAAVFSVVHAFLLEPFNVPHAERLALLRVESPVAPMHGYDSQGSLRFFVQTLSICGGRTGHFRVCSCDGRHVVPVSDTRRGPRMLPGAWVSGNAFSVLQIKPQAGRLLREADDKPGGSTAVISDAFWSSAFGRDPKAIGKMLRLNDHDVTIAGVLPANFHGIEVGSQVVHLRSARD